MVTNYDVLGIGNAIMDIIAPIRENILVEHDITKGAMTLVDEARATSLHKTFAATSNTVREIPGGSGANTLAGIAALGIKGAYIGKVADDALGERFIKSLRQDGVRMSTQPLKGGLATARCLIGVTPDGERSMSTFLGANTAFSIKDIDKALVQSAAVTYLEGYLFDTEPQKRAFVRAAEIAQAGGRQVALTLSDTFCVDRHRAAFLQLVEKHTDILFANESELFALYQTNNLMEALQSVWKTGTTACITRSEHGSVIIENGHIHEIKAVPVRKVVDTTGAGDQYAAGVLAGRAMELNWVDAGKLGSLCAAEVITHYGARPETSIHDLVRQSRPEL